MCLAICAWTCLLCGRQLWQVHKLRTELSDLTLQRRGAIVIGFRQQQSQNVYGFVERVVKRRRGIELSTFPRGKDGFQRLAERFDLGHFHAPRGTLETVRLAKYVLDDRHLPIDG